MPQKKRKNRKNRAQESLSRPPRQEIVKGQEILDESLIKDGAVKGATADDFSEAGYGCAQYGWTTPKKGNSGIQAVRAHSKVHVRDRRAVVNTLVIQAIVLVIAIVIALSPEFMRFIPTVEIGETRLHVPVDTELIIATTVTISILLTILILFIARQYSMTGKRRWWIRYKWSVRVLVALMWSVAGLAWSDVEHEFWFMWTTPVLVPWVLWSLIGYQVALTRLAVKRRTFKPRNQRKLLKSKTERTDQKINILRRRATVRIRNGLIVLDKLSKKSRDYFDQLGVGKTRLDKGSQQRRLKSEEELRLKIEQRNLRHRQDQDRRRKRGYK